MSQGIANTERPPQDDSPRDDIRITISRLGRSPRGPDHQRTSTIAQARALQYTWHTPTPENRHAPHPAHHPRLAAHHRLLPR